MIFLIVYDRKKAEIVEFRTYRDFERQLADRDRLEREVADNGSEVQLEIVQLQAANEADLRKTHRRYFETVASLASTNIG